MNRAARLVLKQVADQAAYFKRLREIIDASFVADEAYFCVRTLDVTRAVAKQLGRPTSAALAADVRVVAGALGFVFVTSAGLHLFRAARWRMMNANEATQYARDLRTRPVPSHVRVGRTACRVWV